MLLMTIFSLLTLDIYSLFLQEGLSFFSFFLFFPKSRNLIVIYCGYYWGKGKGYDIELHYVQVDANIRTWRNVACTAMTKDQIILKKIKKSEKKQGLPI